MPENDAPDEAAQHGLEEADVAGQHDAGAVSHVDQSASQALHNLLADKPHPALKTFVRRLTALRSQRRSYVHATGETRPMSPYTLHLLLAHRAPELPVSLSQMYRICDGTAMPKIDMVYELAAIFGESPEYFLRKTRLTPAADIRETLRRARKSAVASPHEGEQHERPGGFISLAAEQEAHPALRTFVARLTELRVRHGSRVQATGEQRPMSAYTLHFLLAKQAPELPVSLSQMYRICDGTAMPKIDMLYELAAVFGVSPQRFLAGENQQTTETAKRPVS